MRWRLEAQESLLAVARARVGSGWMKKADATAIVRRWERQAQAPEDRPKRGNFVQQLQSLGVPIVVVPPKKKAAADEAGPQHD